MTETEKDSFQSQLTALLLTAHPESEGLPMISLHVDYEPQGLRAKAVTKAGRATASKPVVGSLLDPIFDDIMAYMHIRLDARMIEVSYGLNAPFETIWEG